MPDPKLLRSVSISRLAETLVLAVLAWQTATLLWSIFSTADDSFDLRPPQALPAMTSGSPDAVLGWYGADKSASLPYDDNYTLIAVIAGKHGAALLKEKNGTSIAVRIGDEIRPGNTLVAVDPTQATIEHLGQKHIVRLPQTESGKAQPIAPAPTPSAPERSLPAIRVIRHQFARVWQDSDPNSLGKGLSSSGDEGIRITKAERVPFARILRLKDGDLLTGVNQRPLKRLDDISLLSDFLGPDDAVELSLIRRGVRQHQHYELLP